MYRSQFRRSDPRSHAHAVELYLISKLTHLFLYAVHAYKGVEFGKQFVYGLFLVVASYVYLFYNRVLYGSLCRVGLLQSEDALCLLLLSLIKYVAHVTCVSELCGSHKEHLLEIVLQPHLVGSIKGHLLSLKHHLEDVVELFTVIVVEMYRFVETGSQSTIALQELAHLLVVACCDTDKFSSSVFHQF